MGNETLRWHPDEGWLEIKLPAPLARLANRPHGRYRLSCPVPFAYRGDEVAAQAASGAVRYDISQDPASGRWYLDASWRTPRAPAPSLEELRRHPVVALDVNAGHLAVAVVAADGNVLGTPATIGLDLAGLPAATRDGRLRAAITSIIATARQHGARAIVIEDLDFAQARAEGRERAGSRPSRGRRGRPSDGWWRASPPASSVTGWSRWPPTRACTCSSPIPRIPPGGGPSTGSPRCGSTTPTRPVTTPQRW